MEVLKQVQDDEVGLDDGSLKMPFVSSEVERRCVRALAGVSTLTCPERLPWQAAEGLGANGGGDIPYPRLVFPAAGHRRRKLPQSFLKPSGPSPEIAAYLMVH
jgi:hypothetical protein